jgi:hypothetical protein
MTLTTALALLAGVVLVALLLHGWWSTRKARPRAPWYDGVRQADDRVEPSMLPEDAADISDIPTLPNPSALPGGAAGRRGARIDALIDAIVTITLELPISAEAVLAHLPASRRAGSKPFLIEGLDTETAEWDPPTPGRRYGELQAGVQLTSRSGALNEIEYSEFVQKVQAFADAIGGATDVPDMREVVARARELDGLSSPLDAQLNVTLRSNGVAWSVAYVQQVAGRLGFVPGVVPGRLVLPAAEESAPPLLALSVDVQAAMAAAAEEAPQASAIRQCQLALDVPQTPASVEPFPTWHRIAGALAEELDATVVDDYGEPITLQAYVAIGRELEELYAKLEALDLAAGSP